MHLATLEVMRQLSIQTAKVLFVIQIHRLFNRVDHCTLYNGVYRHMEMLLVAELTKKYRR